MGGKHRARQETVASDQQKAGGGAAPAITERDGTLILTVRVTPRAGRDDVTFDGVMLRARLTALPVEGAANAALVDLLAARLNVPRRAIAILRGHTARTKTIAIRGMSAATLQQRLGG